MAKIILGVTGSIAAYKANDIVSKLKKNKHEVVVCLTNKGSELVNSLTLQTLSKNKVYQDIIQDDQPDFVAHIELAKWADLIVIAPATATTIARLAHGIADDMLSAVVLAGYQKKLIIAPAMNEMMYANPITQNNIKILKDMYRAIEVEPKTALLACGDYGKGALANVDDIIDMIEENL